MSSYFLDSSALVKRYVDEVGSEWVRSITEPSAGQMLLVAQIGIVEVAAAFAARFRARPPRDPTIPERSLRRFLGDCDQLYAVLAIVRSTIDLAVVLTGRHRLRGYDAVQLASALAANEALTRGGQPSLTLVSADHDLLEAAPAEGLEVENPLEH